MKGIAFCVFLTLLSLLFADETSKPSNRFNSFVNHEVVAKIKKSGATWQAFEPHENPFRNYSDKDMKYVMSMPGFDYEEYKRSLNKMEEAKMRFRTMGKKNAKGIQESNVPAKGFSLPDSFDWRDTAIGKICKPTILNQGICGCCYSFATAESFSARLCAVKGGPFVAYSPQDLLACNKRTMVCDGGVIDICFNHIEEYGISTLECMPYAEGDTPDGTKVPSVKCNSLACNVATVSFTKAFCKKGTSVQLTGRDKIQNEIKERGPLASLMTVWSDLSNYKSGIYKQTTGSKQGGHAILLLGWGVENGVSYWIVQNSWGAEWGDNGVFKIDMSDTNSEMASSAFYCVPDA
jgi:cathepsin B